MSARNELFLAAVVAAAILLPGLASFTLVDPWEGHYAEVGRRILEDDDWIRLRWQNEVFRSKPALAPWLIAASLRAHGLADRGGFSGEMASTSAVVWAVRLPFALCGVLGMLAVWLALRRLASRRAAWLGLLVLGATPFYALVARQAMTDMPMVMATAGAIAAFALALGDGDAPLARGWRGLTIAHAVLALIAVVATVQVVYDAAAFVADPRVGRGLRAPQPHLWLSVPFGLGLAALVALTCAVWPMRTRRDAYLLAGYALVGVGILAKGPPGAAVVLATCASYIAVTGQWRTVRRLRPIEGLLVIGVVAGPWHLAMTLRDGQPFIAEYFGHHWLKRAADGVHAVNRAGEGTLAYFAHQLGIGLWPVLVAVPGAVLAALTARPTTPREHLRWLALLWAAVGFALFTAVETKYHHYVLPVVPAFAILVALWLDDVLAGRARAVTGAAAAGAVAAGLVALDVAAEPARFVELFCYRYDRPWPSGPPWRVDLTWEVWAFAAASASAGVALCAPRTRRTAVVIVVATALAFGHWVTNRYMRAAGPHWGQGHLHRAYYAQRRITGVTLRGRGGRLLVVDALVPDDLHAGQPMTAVAADGSEHPASVLAVWRNRMWLHVPDFPARVAHPRATVDGERLIAFNLFWRAELFWSGGELWGSTDDMRSVFRHGHEADFRAYLARPDAAGRRFFAITEASQVDVLRRNLPAAARESLHVFDRTSNKFTLVRFELPPR